MYSHPNERLLETLAKTRDIGDFPFPGLPAQTLPAASDGVST
jgi:hypothetical protein